MTVSQGKVCSMAPGIKCRQRMHVSLETSKEK
jgi:hypothetical protein